MVGVTQINGNCDESSFKLFDPALWRTNSLVNGKWLSAPKTFQVRDPGTEKVVSNVADHGAEETEEAIKAAHEAFKGWNSSPAKERGDFLARLAALMTESIEDLATIISVENGKNRAEARGECLMSIGQLEWMAGEAVRGYGDVIPSALPGVRNVVLKQGLGVVGIITPWKSVSPSTSRAAILCTHLRTNVMLMGFDSFPQSMIVRKCAAAFAAGCSVVVKAPRETPHSSLAFGVLVEKAGGPAGLYNVICTNRSSVVGRVLCENPLVRKISFTGSTPVGKVLMAQAASTLSKCSFELGGNAPFIVFNDADVEKAATAAAAVKFRCSGQVCIAANRLLVQSGVHDEFVKALTAKVKEFKVGYGLDEGVTHGPLINAKAVDKAEEHVTDATKRGATLVFGGQKLGGNFYQPTILTGVDQSMLIADDETFGPVAAIFKFETEDECLRLANDTEYGLAGYFFSNDMGRVWRVAEALEVGMVGVNGASVSQPSAPFGGVKQSGYGREGSRYGMEEFQNIKLIAINIA